jgi:hypothetical protein
VAQATGFRDEKNRAPAGAPEIAAMRSTHLSLHFHIVFSTKNREPRIAPEWRDRLHAYLGVESISMSAFYGESGSPQLLQG